MDGLSLVGRSSLSTCIRKELGHPRMHKMLPSDMSIANLPGIPVIIVVHHSCPSRWLRNHHSYSEDNAGNSRKSNLTAPLATSHDASRNTPPLLSLCTQFKKNIYLLTHSSTLVRLQTFQCLSFEEIYRGGHGLTSSLVRSPPFSSADRPDDDSV